MSVIFILLFVGIAIGIGTWIERKRSAVPQEAYKTRPTPFMQGTFVHPGHTWVEVVKPNLVAVGADGFTKSVFGSVDELTLPEPGTMVQQGGKAWHLRRGKRQLAQTAPISGRVVEVNQYLSNNPQLLAEKDPEKSWILKIQPIGLKRQLRNLLHGDTLTRWNQAIKEQLISILGVAEFSVLQDGGEIAPDLGDKLTDQQWEKAKRELFN